MLKIFWLSTHLGDYSWALLTALQTRFYFDACNAIFSRKTLIFTGNKMTTESPSIQLALTLWDHNVRLF